MCDTNRKAIHLNNIAVDHLLSGNIVEALDALQSALPLTAHNGSSRDHTDSFVGVYEFQCFDCSPANTSRFLRRKDAVVCLNEGMSSCICLCALKIAATPDKLDVIENLCPCGHAWVIWYNLAVVSIFLGTRLGEKGFGLLDQAYKLFNKVQMRLDAEPTSDSAWSLLKLAVVNNQACIQHELSMTKPREQYLDRLQRILRDSVRHQEVKYWDIFRLNAQVLRGQVFAGAA
jgi:hypothetical protein